MHSLCTTVCPYAFYTVALDHMEAGKASILCSCEPVAAMVFGFFFFRAIPHNSKYRYGERGAADAKPKAQIILDAAKVSAASGGCSEPKQGQRSQSARSFCPRSTMRVPQPDIIEHFGNADAVPQPPKRCLSRKVGIVRCCLCIFLSFTPYRAAHRRVPAPPSPRGSTPAATQCPAARWQMHRQ